MKKPKFFWGLGSCGRAFFQGKGASYIKNKYNPFYHKFRAEYFVIRLFFFEKGSIFWEKCEKPFFGAITIFEWKAASDDKNEYNLFTALLLGYSRSAHLFGMFFRYQWRYLCFLPTLLPVWWDWGSAVSGLATFSTQTLGMATLLWQRLHHIVSGLLELIETKCKQIVCYFLKNNLSTTLAFLKLSSFLI